MRSPAKFEIILSEKEYEKISSLRDSALKEGIINSEHKKYVNAKVIFGPDTSLVKLRLKGGMLDHIAGEKWSFRIKLKGSDEIIGMKHFSIQAPETRRMLNEWIMFRFLREEKLISLNYDFINVSINGSNKGIYAIEQSFDHKLLASNHKDIGPIIKISDDLFVDYNLYSKGQVNTQEDIMHMSEIDCFLTKKTFKSKKLRDQFIKAQALMKSFISGKIELDSALDVNSFAKLYAISELLSCYHALRWKNFRAYYNPKSEKLEPIAFDGNCGFKINEIYYKSWNNNRIFNVDKAVKSWKNLFFQNKLFIKQYFKYLKKYSDKEYLDKFFSNNKNLIDEKLGILFNDYPEYIFLTESYYHNAEIIRKSFTTKEHTPIVIAHLNNSSDSTKTQQCEFQLINTTFYPVEIIDITYKNSPITSELSIMLDGKKENMPLVLNDFSFNIPIKYQERFTLRKKILKDFNLRYRTYDSEDTISTTIYSYSAD